MFTTNYARSLNETINAPVVGVKDHNKSVKVGDKYFKVIHKSKAPAKFESLLKSACRYEGTLHQCYERPSYNKERIYDEWENFYYYLKNHESFGICSYNTHCFTVSFVAGDVVFYITPAHNYILADK